MIPKSHAIWSVLLLAGALGLACNAARGLDEARDAAADTDALEDALDTQGDTVDAPGDTTIQTDTTGDTSGDTPVEDVVQDTTLLCGSVACSATEQCCDDACVDTNSDATHCGACAQACGALEACTTGQCLCGGGACASYETCGGAACTLDDWWFVTTRFDRTASSDAVVSVRGTVAFSDATAFIINDWEDTRGDTGGFGPEDAGTVTISSSGGVTLIQNGVTWTGQISEDGQIMFAVSYDDSAQVLGETVWVRRSGGHDLASVNDAQWRVVAIKEAPSPRWLDSMQGTVTIDASNEVSGTIQVGDVGTVSLSNQATPIAVDQDGLFSFYFLQNDSLAGQFRGHLTGDDQIAVMTRLDALHQFQPGTVILMKTSTSATDADLSGTWSVGHLRHEPNEPGLVAFGGVPFDGGGGISASAQAIDVFTDTPGAVDIANGLYSVDSSGASVTRIVDGDNVASYSTGQLAPPSDGSSDPFFMASYAAASYSTTASPTMGSLLLWIRRF